MDVEADSTPNVCDAAKRGPDVRRWTLVALGVLCVGLGGLGALLPGLPTTIFLIAASWCFARSCPWLEERLVRNRFFRPYLRYLDGGGPMPARVLWLTLALMWGAIGLSTALLWYRDSHIALALAVPLAGAVGTAFILRTNRRSRRAESRPISKVTARAPVPTLQAPHGR